MLWYLGTKLKIQPLFRGKLTSVEMQLTTDGLLTFHKNVYINLEQALLL